jgi:pimeloyl-ACP methyl ester carboxylesterase
MPSLDADSPSGRPSLGTLVLLHAFPLDARMWEPQRRLSCDAWRIVMPQFRGFDPTREPVEPAASIDDYVDDLVALLDERTVDRAVVCGLSMGGYVALALYRRAPHRIKALVLADTRADADSVEARANRERLMALVRTAGASAIVDDMVPKLLGATTRATAPDLEAHVRSLVAGQWPEAIVSALRAMMTRADSTPLLPSIAVPTLVVVGDEDVLTPPAIAASMASQIPGAAMIVLPQAGHLSSVEQPSQFNAALLTFLNRL